jgi:hypothetical protein
MARDGWILEINKSDSSSMVSHIKDYLGFTINTERMIITKPISKLDKLVLWEISLIEKDSIHVKQLAQILGKIVSL